MPAFHAGGAGIDIQILHIFLTITFLFYIKCFDQFSIFYSIPDSGGVHFLNPMGYVFLETQTTVS